MASKRREATDEAETMAGPPIATLHLSVPVNLPGHRAARSVIVQRKGAGIRCERVEPESLGPIAGFVLHFSGNAPKRFIPATSVALVELEG